MADSIATKKIKVCIQENGIIRLDNTKNFIGKLNKVFSYKDIPEYKENFSDAVKLVTKEIREDESLRIGYIANIAMAFVDECNEAVGFKNVPYNTLHKAANKAAERFLDNWCRE